MPWRDEGMIVFGESARDLARHFIQRWNQCKVKKYFDDFTINIGKKIKIAINCFQIK